MTTLTKFRERLNRLWRAGVIGVCFILFGIGGVCLGLGIFPLMRLLPGDADTKRGRARRLIGLCFRALVGFLRGLRVMTVEFHGEEHLQPPRNVLVLANHPTYLDVVLLLSRMPGADCVVKSGLWRNIFFRGVVREADYVSNSTPESLIDSCAAVLGQGRSLLVFPEGTRTVPGQPLHFLRGSAHIAIKSRCDILPVILRCDPPVLTKNRRWYHMPPHPFHFRLEVKPVIHAADWVNLNEPGVIAARKLTDKLENYFMTELATHERAAA